MWREHAMTATISDAVSALSIDVHGQNPEPIQTPRRVTSSVCSDRSPGGRGEASPPRPPWKLDHARSTRSRSAIAPAITHVAAADSAVRGLRRSHRRRAEARPDGTATLDASSAPAFARHCRGTQLKGGREDLEESLRLTAV